MSVALAAPVSVGGVWFTHFTEAGQVASRLPVPSCVIRKRNLPAPPSVGAVNVNVQLAVSVIV